MRKRYEAIPIEGGCVVVDKEAIVREGDWVQQDTRIYKCIASQHLQSKVIATIHKDMREEGIPLIVMPDEQEEDFDDWYKKQYHLPYPQNNSDLLDEMTVEEFWDRMASAYNAGYKAAQNKGTYTEEDMKKAMLDILYAREWDKLGNKYGWVDNYIQSLQKTIKAVELETEDEMRTSAFTGEDKVYMGDGTDKIKVNPDLTITPKEVIYDKTEMVNY